MAINLEPPQELLPIKGVKLASFTAGIKGSGQPDLAVVVCDPGTEVVGVFTRNLFCAAPVQISRKHLQKSPTRALIINSGNANAGTGQVGFDAAVNSCQFLASCVGCEPHAVLPFSTGVIGERLPIDLIQQALVDGLKDLDENNWRSVAEAIMTTDTVPKGVSRQFVLNGKTVTVTGIAKGAGMICPDMATLLAFIATDLSVENKLLEACLKSAIDKSFNRITVDGDTSTNDSCILMATGTVDAPPLTDPETKAYQIFSEAIGEVMIELATSVIRDAEGATKFTTIDIFEGATETDCLQVAHTIAHSPLVKTAFFASDPNWGRILAAIGRSGIHGLDMSQVSIYLNELCIVSQGAVDDEYTEQSGQQAMHAEEIDLTVNLGMGSAKTRVWTSDLSYDYVRINAEYRT